MAFNYYRKPKNKYGAKSTKCAQGHRHDSCLEAMHCNRLEMLLKAGEIIEIVRQYTIPLVVNGCRICSHRVDFKVQWKNGFYSFIESKGFPTREWEIKHKLTEALFPETKYEVWTK